MGLPNQYTAEATLVGANQAIATGQFSASVAITIGTGQGTNLLAVGGEILATYIVQHIGSGAVLSDMFGDLLVFDSDPSLAAASTTLTSAQARMVIGRISFLNSELDTDTNTAQLGGLTDIPFAPATKIWAAFFWRGATTINSAGGDDEVLELRLGINRTV